MSEADTNLWNTKREAQDSISNSRYESQRLSKNIAGRAQIRLATWEARLAAERQLDHHRERESRGERPLPQEKSLDPLQAGLFEAFSIAQRETVIFFPEGYPVKQRDRSNHERE